MTKASRTRRGRPVVNISFPAETLAVLDRLVKERGTNRTEVIVEALRLLDEKG